MSSSSSKKRKVEDENRLFQEKWENSYFVTNVRDKIHCVICLQHIAVCKEYNVHIHYNSLHREQYDALSGKVREEKLEQPKFSFAQQRNLCTNSNKSSKDLAKVSFVISDMIAKSSRPFTEGQFIKECFIKACEIVS